MAEVIEGDGWVRYEFPMPEMTPETQQQHLKFMAWWWGCPIDELEVDEDCYLIDPATGERHPWFTVVRKRS